jgi:type IV fimbrial biogenesis protein FimT
VCPSSDGSTCLGSNTWQSGWIVFVDLNATGALDNAADVVLRRRAAWAQGDTFVAIPAITSVIYGGQGFAVNLTATTMPVHTTPPNGNATQCLSLNAVGHLSVQSPGIGTCS